MTTARTCYNLYTTSQPARMCADSGGSDQHTRRVHPDVPPPPHLRRCCGWQGSVTERRHLSECIVCHAAALRRAANSDARVHLAASEPAGTCCFVDCCLGADADRSVICEPGLCRLPHSRVEALCLPVCHERREGRACAVVACFVPHWCCFVCYTSCGLLLCVRTSVRVVPIPGYRSQLPVLQRRHDS